LSVYGTKRTSMLTLSMSAFKGKADIPSSLAADIPSSFANVR